MAEGLNAIRVLTETELCRTLGISNKTFERMRYRGDVPPKTQLSDRRVGYRVCMSRNGSTAAASPMRPHRSMPEPQRDQFPANEVGGNRC